MKLITTKAVEKLLQSLNNDPRLQTLDDTTILSEEQYPVAFDALIMRIKDPITLTTTVDTLNYNEKEYDSLDDIFSDIKDIFSEWI